MEWFLEQEPIVRLGFLFGMVGITAPLVFVGVYALASVLFLPGMVMTRAGGHPEP